MKTYEHNSRQLNARHKPKYELLTFYKFVDIPDSELDALAQDHLDFCRDIGLKGRVYLGTEGISSTVSGNIGQCKAYRMYLDTIPYFRDIPDIDTKSTPVESHKFPRMSVKIREEIVALGSKVTEEDIKKYKKELTPQEFKDILESDKKDDYVILDMRNDYEYKLGHFKHAIPAGTVNFREVPNLLKRYSDLAKGKKIIWYCTGWIRCEKAAVLANRDTDTEFYSIQWGVVKYVNEHNDGNWLGNLYTFDDRVSTFVGDEATHTTIGECIYTGKPTDNCENCRYAPCNARILADHDEFVKHMGFCSEECALKARRDWLVKVVDWDDMDYKALWRTWRNDPSKKEEIMQAIDIHLVKKLENVEFNHKTSQKEDVIYAD